MKISLSWLKELVDYQLSSDDLANRLSLSSIGVKQQTEDYLELDLTYNRGDLLSLRGVADEVAAITDSPLRFLAQTPEDYIWAGQNLPKAQVLVEDENLSPIYCVAKIENLIVEQSNKTWVKKLSDCGIRAINNIADVTNLIMIEYGQPMHAFNTAKVKDENLIVRTAQKGERLTTLDGKTRNLVQTDLLITDSEKVLGLAGVMGGKESEVSESTTSILLEAAIFNPIAIRKTSKIHGLYSEASKRFQHGLSPLRLLQALDAAIKMYQSLGGKLTAINLVGDFNHLKKSVNLSIKKVNNLLGLRLDEETITSCLKRLQFTINKKGEDILAVTPPYFRMDIDIEEDLIEEVARMYGYEKIEGIKLVDETVPSLDQTFPNFAYDLKLKLKEVGLVEVQTYSFYSTAVLEALRLTTEGEKSPVDSSSKSLIKIANPISSETEYLRRDLWPNLLEVIGKNIKKGYKDIRIFEMGKTYCRDENGKPYETDRLSIALMNGSDNPLGELYVILNTFVTLSVNSVKNLIIRSTRPLPNRQSRDSSQARNDKIQKITLTPSTPPEEVAHLLHPKRFVKVEKEGRQIAGLAEVHLRILNKLGIEKRVAVMEINLEDLV